MLNIVTHDTNLSSFRFTDTSAPNSPHQPWWGGIRCLNNFFVYFWSSEWLGCDFDVTYRFNRECLYAEIEKRGLTWSEAEELSHSMGVVWAPVDDSQLILHQHKTILMMKDTSTNHRKAYRNTLLYISRMSLCHSCRTITSYHSPPSGFDLRKAQLWLSLTSSALRYLVILLHASGAAGEPGSAAPLWCLVPWWVPWKPNRAGGTVLIGAGWWSAGRMTGKVVLEQPQYVNVRCSCGCYESLTASIAQCLASMLWALQRRWWHLEEEHRIDFAAMNEHLSSVFVFEDNRCTCVCFRPTY